MLDEAIARIAAHDWSRVELVKSAAAVYVVPSAMDGILPIVVILHFKRASGWFMNKATPVIAMLLTRQFGDTLEMASPHVINLSTGERKRRSLARINTPERDSVSRS